jgi:heme-degrading monooxygenase HmoA
VTSLILRRWIGRIRTADAEEYVAYIVATGAAEYRAIDGNRGYQIIRRDLDNDETEIATLSWWDSWDAIKRFAGPDPTRAHYYPEDDRYLIDRPDTVEHFDVVVSDVEAMRR